MSSGPRDPEARAPRPDRRDWPKAKLVVPENALREAGMGRSPLGTTQKSRSVRPMSAVEGNPDIHRRPPKGRD